jgi:hypothetical protein
MSQDDVKGLTEALAAPFDPCEVRFKPAAVSGNRALALAYVDARVIQDRLDDVLGIDGWQDNYECLPDGNVVCTLRCRLGDAWVTKVDVGGPSEQPEAGDRMKAAFSDALKRAAVKFGIGRYLYRLPAQWVDWDAQHKRFSRPPAIPIGSTDGAKVTEREVQALRDLLAAKGKTERAALQAAGKAGARLSDLSHQTYLDLTRRLEKLPDKPAGPGTAPVANGAC